MAIAGVLLTVIFIPFQQANAFTVTTNLPGATGVNNEISNSVAGEPFEITIDVAPGELISVEGVTLIVDNGLPSLNRADFNSVGDLAGGNSNLVLNNEIVISAQSDGGYAYGFGTISTGITGQTGNSYNFVSTDDYLGGNNADANTPGTTDFVIGLLGPGTITITGTLKTASLAAGIHTLDVLIDTGAGGNGEDQLVAPQLDFDVTANNNVVDVTVNVPANTPASITIPSTGATVSISFGGGGSGSVTVEKKTLANLNTQVPGAFTSVGSSTASFTVGGSSANTVGEVFEFDLSGATFTGSVRVTVPYNSALLGSGQNPTIFRWSGAAWEQGSSVTFNSTHVSGTFSGLSPVVAGALSVPSTPSGGGSTGGSGGRSVAITWPTLETKDDAYFLEHPLEKFKVSSAAFLNAASVSVTEAQAGQQISIAGTFSNHQQKSQSYAFIVQVIDENDFVTDLMWQQGTLGAGSTTDVSNSWTPQAPGVYKVTIFVWDGISSAPTPLSQVTVKNIAVS